MPPAVSHGPQAHRDQDALGESPENGLTVIIPVYRGMATLPSCLDALASQTAPSASFEVVVVDNGDNPGITELLAGYPRWRLLHEEKPSSYAARNRALEAGTGPLIAFTDADCRPASDWLEHGRNLLLSDSSIGLIGGPVDLDPRASGPTNDRRVLRAGCGVQAEDIS